MDFFVTHVSNEAAELVARVLSSKRLSEGAMVQQFESALARELGLSRPRTVNSGTSALHLALLVAGVGPGHEVLIPPQTFVATGLSVLMTGAKPVFVDIDPATGNMDAAAAAQAVTPRTKAMMPVHWAGIPCDMRALNEVARRHSLAVVEDAAHALGATLEGKPVGTLSRFTCFSFQAIKHLTTGDGGAICCTDPADEEKVVKLRWFGIDRNRDLPDETGERQYNLAEVGFKYHLNDFAAALGLGNLSSFLERLHRRRAVAASYLKLLDGIPGLTLPRVPPNSEPAWWLFTVRAQRRAHLMAKLRERNVPCSVVHRRIDRNGIFGGVREELEGQALFDREQFSLPCHEELSDADVLDIARTIRSGW